MRPAFFIVGFRKLNSPVKDFPEFVNVVRLTVFFKFEKPGVHIVKTGYSAPKLWRGFLYAEKFSQGSRNGFLLSSVIPLLKIPMEVKGKCLLKALWIHPHIYVLKICKRDIVLIHARFNGEYSTEKLFSSVRKSKQPVSYSLIKRYPLKASVAL